MFLQQQLADTRAEFQKFRDNHASDNRVHELTQRQQQDRILRLENIVGACASLMLANGGVPIYLQKMIAHDAPGALEPLVQNQTGSSGNADSLFNHNNAMFSSTSLDTSAASHTGRQHASVFGSQPTLHGQSFRDDGQNILNFFNEDELELDIIQ